MAFSNIYIRDLNKYAIAMIQTQDHPKQNNLNTYSDLQNYCNVLNLCNVC